MSRSRNEVHFEDSLSFSSGRTSPDSAMGSEKTRSDESRDGSHSDDSTPRGILKTGYNSDESYLTHQESDMFRFNKSFLPGLHDWTSWRTRVNDAMIDLMEERRRIFSYPGSIRHIRKHNKVFQNLTEPKFGVHHVISDFALERAVNDFIHGDEGLNLDAPVFISFGIPRVKLHANASYISPSKKTEATVHRAASIYYPTRFNECELQRSKLNARYYKGLPRRTVDQTVVIASSVNGRTHDGCVERPQELETICATMDISDEADEYFT